MSKALRVDIFCAVIDNFGDAGVCWRLARQLAAEHACAVRLFIDEPAVLRQLIPAWREGEAFGGVSIRQWRAAMQVVPAEIVIEAFACDPPGAYIAAMRKADRPPVWINLEYLSAEDWVEGCHALPSLRADGLRKHFFFPGFTARTGGLLREATLDDERRAFQGSADAQAAFWREAGLTLADELPDTLKVSLFAYANAAVPELLQAWADGAQPVLCAVPRGLVTQQVEAWTGQALASGQLCRRGALSLAALPFLPQADYDRLLWACDLNFVRGEDSFVRAQWARRPFVWNIYAQEERAHRVKLDAFLEKYAAGLTLPEADALKRFWHAWDEGQGAGAAWPGLVSALTGLRSHAETWAERMAGHGDLAAKLLIFCAELIE